MLLTLLLMKMWHMGIVIIMLENVAYGNSDMLDNVAYGNSDMLDHVAYGNSDMLIG